MNTKIPAKSTLSKVTHMPRNCSIPPVGMRAELPRSTAATASDSPIHPSMWDTCDFRLFFLLLICLPPYSLCCATPRWLSPVACIQNLDTFLHRFFSGNCKPFASHASLTNSFTAIAQQGDFVDGFELFGYALPRHGGNRHLPVSAAHFFAKLRAVEQKDKRLGQCWGVARGNAKAAIFRNQMWRAAGIGDYQWLTATHSFLNGASVRLTERRQTEDSAISVKSRGILTFLAAKEFNLIGAIESGHTGFHFRKRGAVAGNLQGDTRKGRRDGSKSFQQGENSLALQNVGEEEDLWI